MTQFFLTTGAREARSRLARPRGEFPWAIAFALVGVVNTGDRLLRVLSTPAPRSIVRRQRLRLFSSGCSLRRSVKQRRDDFADRGEYHVVDRRRQRLLCHELDDHVCLSRDASSVGALTLLLSALPAIAGWFPPPRLRPWWRPKSYCCRCGWRNSSLSWRVSSSTSRCRIFVVFRARAGNRPAMRETTCEISIAISFAGSCVALLFAALPLCAFGRRETRALWLIGSSVS